jgi:hypothetical protein
MKSRMLAGAAGVGALLFAAPMPAALAQAGGSQQQGSGIGAGSYGAGGAVSGGAGIGAESVGSGMGTPKSVPENVGAYSVGGMGRDRATMPSAGTGGMAGPSEMPMAGSTPGGLGSGGAPQGRRP